MERRRHSVSSVSVSIPSTIITFIISLAYLSEHDLDKNKKLDGLELLAAMHHSNHSIDHYLNQQNNVTAPDVVAAHFEQDSRKFYTC